VRVERVKHCDDPQQVVRQQTILVHWEETLKIRLVIALLGLAISFAVPSFAQQKDTVDPKIVQQIRVLTMKYEEAYNSYDAAAVAALYTEDGALVTTHNGIKHGWEAIAEYCAKIEFQFWHANNLVKTVDRVIAVGNEIRVFGRWNCAFKDDAYTRNVEGHLGVTTRKCQNCPVRENQIWTF
jgi:uncharacterized protein (TIGR02246 family)